MYLYQKFYKMKWILRLCLGISAFIFVLGCSGYKKQEKISQAKTSLSEISQAKSNKNMLSEAFKSYWYSGDAEVTSYRLEQARYGEIREGKAVLIYVTEPFLPKTQVKADGNAPTNIPVLKLNKTKNYLTGIYPYSIMSSTFYPVDDNRHALKTSLSIQEWCGHVYSQLNNREQFEFTSHSYFEGEADQQFSLDRTILENEIWNKLRINPQGLPIGEISIIPSLEYFRTQHLPVQAFSADAQLKRQDSLYSYSLKYKDTERKLTLYFSAQFPYEIKSWEEEFKSGFGANAQMLTSKGTLLKSIKTPYWQQNSNAFLRLRDSLEL